MCCEGGGKETAIDERELGKYYASSRENYKQSSAVFGNVLNWCTSQMHGVLI